MHTMSFLVIFLITIKLSEATLDLASFYSTYKYGDPLPGGLIILDHFTSTSCTMHCRVQVNESLPTPQVSWLYEDTRDKFVDLNDFDYWDARYRNHYCYSPAPGKIWPKYFREYYPSIDSTCVEQVGNSSDGEKAYDCSLELKSCLLGTYKCMVSVGDLEIPVSESTTFVIHDPGIAIEPPYHHNLCHHPKAENLSVAMGKSDDDGNYELSVSWSATQPNAETCNMPYCEGSQTYLVKILGYHSVPIRRRTKPDFQTKWFKVTQSDHNKTHVFSDSRISPDKYFNFKVRNRRPIHTPTDPPTFYYTRTAKLGILYFGKQERANLIEPVQNQVHNVHRWETVLVKCSGAGLPLPTVTLFHNQNGALVVLEESTGSSSFVQREIIAISSEMFYCTARNHIVNSQGKVEEVVQRASITVNMVEDNIVYN